MYYLTRRWATLWLWVFAICPPATNCVAQGTSADFARAAALRTSVEKTVFRDQVQPNWLDGDRFWYRLPIARDQHEYVYVDASQGRREPLFDHVRLAAAIGQKFGRETQAESLAITNLTVDRERQYIRFTIRGRRLNCDLATYALEELTGSDTSAESRLPPLDDIPFASTQTGDETEVIFVNETSAEVRLFWRSPDGQRIHYGNVASRAEHRQHTFAHHIWEICDLTDQPLCGFVASATPARAVVADMPRARRRPGQSARRRESARSPDGRWQATFVNDNVVLRQVELAPGELAESESREITLTQDGTADDPYTGPVHWSPDSTMFVVLQVRSPQRRPLHLVESSPSDQLQPKLHTVDYLKPGDRIAQPRPRLFDVSTRQQVAIAEGHFPDPWSIDELRWERDSARFTFLYNQRGHQTLRLIAVDRTGQPQPIIDENSSTFIDYHAKRYIHYLEDSAEILWMSERDGWNHLWLYDARSGRVKNAVTSGAWVVRRVLHVDEEARRVWFLAGGVRPGQDPYYLHLCRVQFDGTGFAVLTEGDGTHDIAFSPERRWFLDTWSRVDLPPRIELRRSEDGQLACRLEEADDQALRATGWTLPERFVAKGRDGETDIHGILIRPSNFDPSKRYPVVEQIYAGPHGAHVPKAFGTLVGQHAMAELGFVVVQIDGMGTNWRSKRFHDVCWQNLADAGFPDRIAWLRAAAATRPWLDLDRVGIYGGSAGGQNAMRALLDHYPFYKVAVADCGCHDNRMDKIWWNELWMGYPVGPHYAANSNVEHAHKLQGQLLLIVGELDRNVDPSSTMQVVRALQRADKDFELVVVAGAGHGAAETPYGSRRRSEFLVRHLHGLEPRSR